MITRPRNVEHTDNTQQSSDRRLFDKLRQPPLFRLPPELRQNIYENALLIFKTDLAIIRTCRTINMEAKPVLYRRPLTFSSQAELFDWIDRSSAVNLKKVKTLTLRLTDVDLSTILRNQSSQARAQTGAWELYNTELENLGRAFDSLPNLSTLSIAPPKATHSQLLRSMYLSALAMVAQRFPKLKCLVIDDTNAITNAVPGLIEMENVVFSITAAPASSTNCTKTSKEAEEKRGFMRVKTEKQPSGAVVKAETSKQLRHTATGKKRKIADLESKVACPKRVRNGLPTGRGKRAR